MENNKLYNKIVKDLNYDNQIGSSIVIIIDDENNKDEQFVVTSVKRGNLEVYKYNKSLVPEFDKNGYEQDGLDDWELTLYQIRTNEDNDYSVFCKFVKEIEGSDKYRDGGITTNDNTLAKMIIDAIS